MDNVDNRAFDGLTGEKELLVDYSSMDKSELISYIKSNYKIKDALPFIASNQDVSKIMGMDVADYLKWEAHYVPLKANDTNNRMYNTQYNEQRMQRLYDLGFGQGEGDIVNFVDSNVNVLGASGTSSGQYPGYTGYFNPATWGVK